MVIFSGMGHVFLFYLTSPGGVSQPPPFLTKSPGLWTWEATKWSKRKPSWRNWEVPGGAMGTWGFGKIWLVSNMTGLCSISYMGCHPSHSRTPSFFKMVETTNQWYLMPIWWIIWKNPGHSLLAVPFRTKIWDDWWWCGLSVFGSR